MLLSQVLSSYMAANTWRRVVLGSISEVSMRDCCPWHCGHVTPGTMSETPTGPVVGVLKVLAWLHRLRFICDLERPT